MLSDQEQVLLAGEFRRIELEAGPGERERDPALARRLARTAPAGLEDPELAA